MSSSASAELDVVQEVLLCLDINLQQSLCGYFAGIDAWAKILTFFSKLSAGTGEQMLTRQMARLGNELALDSAVAVRSFCFKSCCSSRDAWFGQQDKTGSIRHDRSNVGVYRKSNEVG